MAKKILFSMLVGAFIMAMAGLVSAEPPVLTFGEQQMQTLQPTADPELQYSNHDSWIVRGAVETGSVPAMKEGSREPGCCNPEVDPAGNTLVRPGIDDGP